MAEEEFIKNINKLREVFNLFDKESDGTININELTNICKCLYKSHKTDDEIKNLHKQFDTDENGKVDFEEFFLAMYKKEDITITRSEIENAFKVFDKKNTGKVSCSELKYVFENLGSVIDSYEIDEIIDAYGLKSKEELEYHQLIDEFFMEDNKQTQ